MGIDRVAELGVDGLELSQRFLCCLQSAVEIRQAPFNRLLENAVGVLAFLMLRFDPAKVGVQHLNFDPALVGLDQFARGLLFGLLQRDLDLAQLDGKFGTQLILVRLNVGEGHGHRRLKLTRGELDGTIPQRWREHEGE